MTGAHTKKTAKPLVDDNIPVTQTRGDDSITLLTREGLKKIREELMHLTNVKRKEVAKRLREAISYGDLSENSEYEDAKNEQAFVEGRILELEDKVKSVKIIDEHHKKASLVQLGMQVKVMNLSNRKKDTVEIFTIVGSTEADPFSNRISNESPIGRALLGKEVGDVVEVVVPAGVRRYKVLDIS